MGKKVRKHTILIADDEPEVVQLVRMILEWEGYNVVAAADGVETLERAEIDKPDLILLDVRMPKMSGLTVLEHLARSETATIPVIMLSVVTTHPEVQSALQRGAVAYLTKPFELKEMTRLVSEVLAMDAAKRDIRRQKALEMLRDFRF
ncbi:MAG: response regulator [Anaerolineae bacterium]|nr:response regulator [Anaerolineae bacterium]